MPAADQAFSCYAASLDMRTPARRGVCVTVCRRRAAGFTPETARCTEAAAGVACNGMPFKASAACGTSVAAPRRPTAASRIETMLRSAGTMTVKWTDTAAATGF